jgi:NADH dehydrogenase
MNTHFSHLKKNRLSPSVVIVGANFAGLNAAVSLPKEFSVTIVDPWPWFEFSPGIHELISGFKTPEMLRFAKETIVNRYHHKIFSEAASAVLPEEKAVITTSGTRLPYDYCIMAVGGQSNTFNVKGADTHAMAFKSVDQCHLIAQRLEALTKRRKSFSIVIAGGGFEGIEALGEILRKYKAVKGIQIHLVEKQEKLMADAPADLDREIRRLCAPYPVKFHTGKGISRVWKHSVVLSDKIKLPSQLTIWTGGAKPPDLLYDSNLSSAPDQWMNVNKSLQHVSYAEIFAAGDAAGLMFPLSKQAYHALDMGKTAAENIIRLHDKKSLKNFKPSSKPMLVSFGDLDAFLIDKRIVVGGPALGLLKEAVFHIVMTQLDPSGIVVKAINTSGRVTRASMMLASAMPVSLASLAKLGKVRIIRK